MRCRGLLALVVCGVGAACTNSENVRLSLDHGLRLEAMDPGASERVTPLERMAADEHAIRPTAVSLDRSSWEPMRMYVPAGGVRHRPSYTDEWIPAYSDRARGLDPTLFSALEKGDAGLEVGFAEGVATLAISVFDAVAIVPRMVFFDPYWEYNDSPEIGYDRQGTRPWIPLAVAPEAEAERTRRMEDDPDRVPGRIERLNEGESGEAGAGAANEDSGETDVDDPGDGNSDENGDGGTGDAGDSSP